MAPPRLVAGMLSAAVLAAPALWAQDDAMGVKEAYKKAVAGEKSGLSGPDHAALKKKLLLKCKKTGDCKPVLLEKKKPGKKDSAQDLTGDESFEGTDEESASGPGTDSVPPDAEEALRLREEAGLRREGAMSRAAGAAEALRRSLFEQDGPPGRDLPGPEDGRASGAPWGAAELALAERAGSGAVFRAQGLKVGAGPQGEPAIQRLDGSPASQADLGRLRAALRAEPAALQRRPDFFAVLTRGQFAELKRGYILRPELRRTAFQHIALTEDARDFRWSSSCSALSGDCNAGAQGMSYKKGQDVPPEVLKEVWDDVGGEQGDEDTDWGEYSEEDRRLAEAEDLAAEKLAHGAGRLRSLGSILAGLGDWARGWGERAGFDGAGPVPASGGGQVRFADGPEGEARQTGAVPSAEAPRQRPGPPPAPQGRRAAGGRAMVYVLAAAGALIALGLRKKA